MSERLYEKQKRLENILREWGKVAVAFSAGVDSSFLLKTAHDLLGDNAVAVTAFSELFPRREAEQAEEFCRSENIRLIAVHHNALETEGFCENPKNRCYICKRALFTKIKAAAKENGFEYVAEGTNTDDMNDYRPGMAAVAQLDIKSPLRDAGLSKSEIRALSEKAGLPFWDKPSFACLASRFAYGERITVERLGMVEQAEQVLFDLGFRQLRVRVHGGIARIEVPSEDIPFAAAHASEINDRLQKLGFIYTALDLGGYKTGNMNK